MAVQVHQLRHAVRILVGVPPGQQAVVGGAQRVDVAAGVHRFGLALLGAHEERRADHQAGLRQLLGRFRGRLGQAEVHDLDRAVGGPHEVGRLEVAVDQPGGVGGRDALAGVDHRLRRLEHRQGAVLLQPVAEAAAGDVLHDQEVRRSPPGRFRRWRRRWGG